MLFRRARSEPLADSLAHRFYWGTVAEATTKSCLRNPHDNPTAEPKTFRYPGRVDLNRRAIIMKNVSSLFLQFVWPAAYCWSALHAAAIDAFKKEFDSST